MRLSDIDVPSIEEEAIPLPRHSPRAADQGCVAALSGLEGGAGSKLELRQCLLWAEPHLRTFATALNNTSPPRAARMISQTM